MTATSFALLVVAGVATGLVGYLTGLASLISYPAMLAVGLPPVAANVTNTVGLVGIAVGSSARSTALLLERGRRHLARQLTVALVGGLVGGLLLLGAGESAFTTVVPWLIALGSALLLLSPRIKTLRSGAAPEWAYLAGLFAVAVYGGYFGAGGGTLFLALALTTTTETFARSMVLKSALVGVANLAAAVLFAVSGPVSWWAALALGIGSLLGGNLGPLAQRLVPEQTMRWVIAAAGLGLAAWLFVRQ